MPASTSEPAPRRVDRPTSRQVNLLLELLITLSFATGVLSWMVPLEWARPFTAAHAISGYSIVMLAPLKLAGSVRAGFRRRRASRHVSAVLGLMIVATLVLGLLHSTGLWFGVGHWTALWTHLLLGFASIPLVVWHVSSRPTRPAVVDLDRRALLGTGALGAVAAGAVVTQEVTVAILDLAGADRAGTGSHELGSFDPENMPSVVWLDDTAPDLSPRDWPLSIDGTSVDVTTLAQGATPLVATLDCTGGWWSDQAWDVVTLADVVPPGEGRSIKVTSATGYARWFSTGSAAGVYLATGYNGEPLARRHGAPLRVVAPGRRGPWWVKWVTSIEWSNRPAWAQLPFPPT